MQILITLPPHPRDRRRHEAWSRFRTGLVKIGIDEEVDAMPMPERGHAGNGLRIANARVPLCVLEGGFADAGEGCSDVVAPPGRSRPTATISWRAS
jgi:hypothetical protein